jgi:hypothetical protein
LLKLEYAKSYNQLNQTEIRTTMKKGSKLAIGIILFIIASIGGCIFLMRGCLSGYDTYSQFDEAKGFKSEKGNVIVFLKEHYVVTSYSSGGGITHISGYPVYTLETRDVATLKLLKSTEFEEKDNPLMSTPHIIGCDDKVVWIFQGKIMAFDAFTHEIICTKEKLEELNSVLKDNLPEDMQYYKYNYVMGRLEITSKDALHYQISNSFKAQKFSDVDKDETPETMALSDQIKKMEEEKKLKYAKVDHGSMDEYFKYGDSIHKLEDLNRKKHDEIKNNKDYNNKIQEIRTEGISNDYDILENAAISDSIVYALLSDKDLEENKTSFYIRKLYSEDVQRSIYSSSFTELEKSSGFNERCKIAGWKPINSQVSFLKGGFLKNKENLEVIELNNPKSWLILSAKEVGDKSKLILQRVNIQGIIVWTKDLPIINFSDMLLLGDYLVLFSNDGEIISGTDKNNWIFSINLSNGQYTMLDLGKKE